MDPSFENLRLREHFLTPEYFSHLVEDRNKGVDADPFVPFSEQGQPRTFKIGKCQQVNDAVVDLQVQFYWRDDYSTEQKELHADMVKSNGVWLLRQLSTGIAP